MAEAVAIGASVIAVIQISERIIKLYKFYIETVQDAPSDLQLILIECSTLKAIFENLNFLSSYNDGLSSSIETTLSGEDGPIKGCQRSITKLEKLFGSNSTQPVGPNQPNKRKVKAMLATLAWPLKQTKAKKLLDQIKNYKTTVTLALTTQSIQKLKDIETKTSKIHDMLTDSQRQEVYKWLQHTDPSPIHHRAQQDYEPKTGNWVLRLPGWARWLGAKQRCLWIHGIPGAGKTVLMSYLIEQIKNHCKQSQRKDVACVYYYCYFGHEPNEAVAFLRWLVSQLCRKADLVPEYVYEVYKGGCQPSIMELLKATETILNVFEVVYVAVDAIDECVPREDLLKIFRDLLTDPRFQKLQLLTSSRDYIDIEKVMEGLSESVSMDNFFVTEDIRLYIRSALQSNPSFSRWPPDLLGEVEYKVSTGAKGMLRWAMCQIDALRRVKCEQHIIKKTLENLPKTLDETYERILLTIPEDESLFVQHALQWIHYHNDLRNGEGISCTILLQAVEKSTVGLCPDQNERFYDEQALQELCGCLIKVTNDYTLLPGEENYAPDEVKKPCRLRVSFAHYTVREYLDSTRISTTSAPYLTIYKEKLELKLLEIVLLEAGHIKPNALRGKSMSLFSSAVDVLSAAEKDFNVYCVIASILSLCKWQREIAQQRILCSLAIDLMDPSRPHFDEFKSAAYHVSKSYTYMTYNTSNHISGAFWGVQWEPGRSDKHAIHLCHLLLLSSSPAKSWILAEKFLRGKDTKGLLRAHLTLTLRLRRYGHPRENYSLNGSIIEVFAQLAFERTDTFKLLLELGTGLFDASKVLLLYIRNHYHQADCSSYCVVNRLLELGANPNMSESYVTPLQIAVEEMDLEGVSMLLKAGADPNGTGINSNTSLGNNGVMSDFKDLHGSSPLYIIRSRAKTKPNRPEIEAILLEYGGRAFRFGKTVSQFQMLTSRKSFVDINTL